MSLHIITGPMCSGKSSSLYRELERHTYRKHRVLFINSSLDTRSTTDISTHGNPITATFRTIKVKELWEVLKLLPDYDVIGIDEAQFFPELVEFCKVICDTKQTYVAGLDGDVNRNAFGSIHELLPFCDTITKLSAICSRCEREAPFTIRTRGTHTSQVEVGGTETYSPVCRKCYLAHNRA